MLASWHSEAIEITSGSGGREEGKRIRFRGGQSPLFNWFWVFRGAIVLFFTVFLLGSTIGNGGISSGREERERERLVKRKEL